MLIGYDVDETLTQFVPDFLRWHNLKYNTCLELEDLNDFDMSKKLGCSRGECVERIFEFYDNPFMDKLLPVSGAVDAVAHLGLKHKGVAVTSRTKFLREITQNSIDKYFYNSVSGLYLTGEWTGNGGKTKAEICVELGVDVLVDDRPKYCYDVIERGIDAILFNLDGKYGWIESNVEMEGLYHAQNWNEIIDIVDKLDSD
mgnify:CR=1 FL=1|jgi:uncharacterized HAD superfamily protein